MALGALAIAAFWDGWRRHVEARRFNQETLSELHALAARVERAETIAKNVVDRLSAQQVARRGPVLAAR